MTLDFPEMENLHLFYAAIKRIQQFRSFKNPSTSSSYLHLTIHLLYSDYKYWENFSRTSHRRLLFCNEILWILGGTRRMEDKTSNSQKLSFYKNNRPINLHYNALHEADYMKIIFESQKTEKKNQAVFHHHSGHPVLCPVIIWSSIIKWTLSYDLPTSSKLNTVKLPNGSLLFLSNNHIITKLRLAASIIGSNKLRFHPKEIGLHSLQSGAAMAMYVSCWNPT